jgi:Fe-S-cluster containining protein
MGEIDEFQTATALDPGPASEPVPLPPAPEPALPPFVPEKPTITDRQPRALFDCGQCPAFCCSVYERVQTNRRDVNRLAKFFGVPFEVAERRYTRMVEGERVLKRVPDKVLDEACMFLDQDTRRCTIYHARPGTCREYPTTRRCAYYDLLRFERRQQGDDTVVPVVRITFQEWRKPDGGGG